MLSGPAAAETVDVSGILDSLASVHRIGEVAISPDGKRVVYGTVLAGKRHGADVDVSVLWIASAKDGSGATRLTACPGAVCEEHGAVWSPDGTRIAFVTTDEKDQPQVAVASIGKANARIITDAHGPLDTPRWSPEGDRIAFLYSEGAPKTPGPLNPLAPDAGVLSSTVYEQRLAIVPARGGTVILLGPADLNIYEFDWSPDGRRFAVTAAHGSGDDNWWIAELSLLDAQSGTMTTLVKPPLQIASPRWSGDGTRIAYISGIMSDEGITGGDIYVITASGGDPVDVTPSLPASVHTLTWNGSSKRIVATEFAAGEEVLAEIDVSMKGQRELWRGAEMIWGNALLGLTPGDSGISLSKDGAVSAVIRQSYSSPPEVGTGPPGKWRPITHLNAAVKPLTGKATNVSWKSDGRSIQGMLVEPPVVVPGKRYGLLIQAYANSK